MRCTKKMLDLLGGRSITLSKLPPTEDDWYLNLLWMTDRGASCSPTPARCSPSSAKTASRSTLGFMPSHASQPRRIWAGVRSADLRPLGVYLVAAIEIELRAESLPTDTFSELEPESVRRSPWLRASMSHRPRPAASAMRYRSSKAISFMSARSNSSPAGSPHAPDRNHFETCPPRAACKQGSVAAHSCRNSTAPVCEPYAHEKWSICRGRTDNAPKRRLFVRESEPFRLRHPKCSLCADPASKAFFVRAPGVKSGPCHRSRGGRQRSRRPPFRQLVDSSDMEQKVKG